MLSAELPEDRIEQALAFYNTLGKTVKVGFKAALANCGCHVCIEMLQRIAHGDLR